MTQVSLCLLQTFMRTETNVVVEMKNFYENDTSVVIFVNISVHENKHVSLLK